MLIRGYIYIFFISPPSSFAGESRSLVGLHGPRLHPAQQGHSGRGEGLPDCQSHCPAQPPCRDAAGAAQTHLCQRLWQTGTDPAALPTSQGLNSFISPLNSTWVETTSSEALSCQVVFLGSLVLWMMTQLGFFKASKYEEFIFLSTP